VPCLALALAGRDAAAAETCDDDSPLCIVGGDDGANWQSGETSPRKDRTRRSTKSGGKLDLTIEGGRGSLFVNGRFRGRAPLEGIAIPAGKNDIQVRDGETILAEGLLTVPRNGRVELLVRHP